MGTILILIGGLIGAGSGFKKSFTTSWIFLINLSFALYISIFLAPFAVSLLDIPGLDIGYKNAIAIGGIFIVTNLILKQITDQIIHNAETDYNLPSISRILGIGAGFLSGIMITGILLYCFMQTPFVSGFSQKKELRSVARSTLMGVVYTLNAFSFQSLTEDAKKDLQSIRLIPKKITAPPSEVGEQGKEEQKDQTKPAENNPADNSRKKDSSEHSPTPDKPDRNKNTDFQSSIVRKFADKYPSERLLDNND